MNIELVGGPLDGHISRIDKYHVMTNNTTTIEIYSAIGKIERYEIDQKTAKAYWIQYAKE